MDEVLKSTFIYFPQVMQQKDSVSRRQTSNATITRYADHSTTQTNQTPVFLMLIMSQQVPHVGAAISAVSRLAPEVFKINYLDSVPNQLREIAILLLTSSVYSSRF